MCGEVTGLGRGCRGYEVTVGPAGIGGGGGVFVCFREVWKGGGQKILPSPIGFVCQWHESGSGHWVRCLVC